MNSTLKNKIPSLPVIFLSLIIAAISVSCGGGGGGGTPAPTSFTVGGTITGLSNTGLVLQNNAGDDINISAANSTFTFATALSANSAYAVSVQTQPVGQNCIVSNSSGTVTNSNITDIVINCSLTDDDASGLYIGGASDTTTVGFANVNGGNNYNLGFIRGMIYNNRFIFFNYNPTSNTTGNTEQKENVLIDGTISSISGNTITATASIYQAGQIVANNITVTGSVTSRTNISLTLSATTAVTGAPAGKFNGGTLNATFSTEFDRGANMARLRVPAELIDGLNRPPVYMVIPGLPSRQFVLDTSGGDDAYKFSYDLVTINCTHLAIKVNNDLVIPDKVLNIYQLSDFINPFDCDAVTNKTGFTGLGALLGDSGNTTWWYASTNGEFSVYIESKTTP